jgi:hypothetical protein
MTNPVAILGGPWPHAVFSAEERAGALCLVDLGHGRSIANDAAAVVRALRSAGYDLDVRRVLYRDPDGVWNEIQIEGGWFHSVRNLNCDSLEAVIGA